MIGVIANPSESSVVREFFELFKTPWEFYRENQQYDVVISRGKDPLDASARLVVIYADKNTICENGQRLPGVSQPKGSSVLKRGGSRIPIYGEALTFSKETGQVLTVEGSGQCAAYLERNEGTWRAWIGYDLFGEVRTLLTLGQPAANASIPTLEEHIAFLRDLITGCGISVVEVPPVPADFEFIACLTHDVDHPSVRQHKFDHTMFGFLFRAVFGSLVDVFFGRKSVQDAVKNWRAAFGLPFVFAGLAKDFWRDFDQSYLQLEAGLPSTFFLIPRKNDPGKRVNGSVPGFRAARYEAKELADTVCRLRNAGCEVALHGIDAWLDSSVGREELEVVRCLAGGSEIGVRMHWLYFNEQSPAVLEKAGAAYDSTVGYNETVGFRPGTAQAYKPLAAERLLELPLQVMDTALFFSEYLGLSPAEASTWLRRIADHVAQHGGCLTINWHDRSLAPERLWGGYYRELLEELKRRGAWFATATQATSWFRKRRSAVFELDPSAPHGMRVKLAPGYGERVAGLRLRIHKAHESNPADRSANYVDLPVDEGIDENVASGAR